MPEPAIYLLLLRIFSQAEQPCTRLAASPLRVLVITPYIG